MAIIFEFTHHIFTRSRYYSQELHAQCQSIMWQNNRFEHGQLGSLWCVQNSKLYKIQIHKQMANRKEEISRLRSHAKCHLSTESSKHFFLSLPVDCITSWMYFFSGCLCVSFVRWFARLLVRSSMSFVVKSKPFECDRGLSMSSEGSEEIFVGRNGMTDKHGHKNHWILFKALSWERNLNNKTIIYMFCIQNSLCGKIICRGRSSRLSIVGSNNKQQQQQTARDFNRCWFNTLRNWKKEFLRRRQRRRWSISHFMMLEGKVTCDISWKQLN